MKSVASVQARLDSLKMKFSGNGTIARSRSDSSLAKEMARMSVERATAFYTKFGFVQVGDHIYRVGTDPQRDIVMARPVQQ